MKRLIIVDDDPGLQDIYKIILKKAGYEVIVYSDGADVMRNDYPKPDLFLLDKQLSGMDGLEICKHLKQQEATRHIPVLIVSASTGIQRQVVAAGADGFIEKPFEKNLLLTVIADHIAIAEGIARSYPLPH